MKRYVEIEPVCPFLGGKPCIKDGWSSQREVFRPCAFFDESAPSETEPCRIRRAANRINGEPDFPAISIEPVQVPWDTSIKE